MTPAAKSNLLNLALYQGGWFSCVFGAADGYAWLGAGAAFLLAAVHATLARARRAEWELLLTAGVLGTVVDSILMHLGIFRFDGGQWLVWFCPVWITVLWMQFASLLHFALRWLKGRYLLGAVLGAMGGPLAYGSGVRLGAAEFGLPAFASLLILAAAWFLVTPVLLGIALWTRPPRGEGEYRL